MKHKRHVIKDLIETKLELDSALRELEALNTDSSSVHIRKAINIVDASLERERESRRR